MNLLYQSGKSLALLFSFIVFLFPTEIVAQDSTSHATLQGWEQRTLNFMLDRSHNFGGTNFNRGLFRYNINLMSPEHEIDLLTYRYTLIDDYKWMATDQGYRSTFGSLNATNFAVENKVKTTYHINDKNTLLISGTHEENLRASRFLFRLGYEHQLATNHYVGIEPTLSNDKSDLDLTAYYRYGNPGKGMIYVGITKLDLAANIVQGLADDSENKYNKTYDETFQYKTSPGLINVRLESPQWHNFRAELRAGYQTYSRKRVNPSADTLDYFDEEWAHFVGALLEYNHPLGVVGVTYQRRFSKLRRQPAPNSDFTNDFTNRQFSDSGGFFITGTVDKLHLEHWMWLERNVDRLKGANVPQNLGPNYSPNNGRSFNFVEHRLKIKSELSYGSRIKGLQAGLAYHADYRHPQGEKGPNRGVRNFDYRSVYPTVRDRSDRLTFTIGYRLNKNFLFEGGLSYDMDKDRQSGIGVPRVTGEQTWFDGGFGRLSLQW
ncbi:hypothetical protein LX73_0257 [Fodinibius salinus]|uniref:Uncharacterized protein n=1 Tax=Fodinibius salinus TaxID=860790 RepID=A0A5D3YPJ8_9BACT|nr:hypothetical protein [Fodinibius salinus]TYP94963.1 hypothetical protein LX73_0257 [Fodinibius salinus]